MTDSALTNHGAIQIGCLARYFGARGVRFTRLFSSPLQRARVTAESLCERTQLPSLEDKQEDTSLPIVVPELREKDFGSMEGKPFHGSRSAVAGGDTLASVEAESRESLVARSTCFFEDYLLPLLSSDQADEEVVAVVAHGIILSYLHGTLLRFCKDHSLTLGPGIDPGIRPTWSNTGYLELDLFLLPDPGPLLRITALTYNGREHLKGLKRTRGGVGSSKHDPKQRKLDSFFKAS